MLNNKLKIVKSATEFASTAIKHRIGSGRIS